MIPISKEDILNKRSLIYYMGSGDDEVEGSKQDVLDSMDEWAKIIAIGFAKYTMENTLQDMNVLDLEGHVDKWEYANKDGYTEEITTEQLFQSYLQTIKP